MAELLRIEGLSAGYGDAVVIDGIGLALEAGGSLALLGRNGVGKTTLLATLMGFTRVRRGTLRWQGRDLSRLPPHRRAQAGIGWVPQERWVFPSLTVEENLSAVARPGHWTLARATNCSHACRSGGATWATSCRAANSRCWPLRAR